MKWGLTLDITVSQLLFSGTYIIGIQAFKDFKQFSEVNITKSENDLVERVHHLMKTWSLVPNSLEIEVTESLTWDVLAHSGGERYHV